MEPSFFFLFHGLLSNVFFAKEIESDSISSILLFSHRSVAGRPFAVAPGLQGAAEQGPQGKGQRVDGRQHALAGEAGGQWRGPRRRRRQEK